MRKGRPPTRVGRGEKVWTRKEIRLNDKRESAEKKKGSGSKGGRKEAILLRGAFLKKKRRGRRG